MMVGQVRLRLGWIFGSRIRGAYQPGCDAAHASGGHEMAAAGRSAVQAAGWVSRTLEVRAPPGHRVEERAQPGAVRLTQREAAVRESGSSDPNLSVIRTIPASQGAVSGLVIDEEQLVYDEEDPVHGVQSVAVE
ncbi:hypothetical protein NDU88_002610 [Pleurodeles waltl]|uniref:Uncharacterized protein n=1 Tax=Pleurodeles waltl TaxID=8319 RepID=A0AAV7T438_PLEWA|nr:hypothetical protein NDU88_002610 [Pleurodeles waltl]